MGVLYKGPAIAPSCSIGEHLFGYWLEEQRKWKRARERARKAELLVEGADLAIGEPARRRMFLDTLRFVSPAQYEGYIALERQRLAKLDRSADARARAKKRAVRKAARRARRRGR